MSARWRSASSWSPICTLTGRMSRGASPSRSASTALLLIPEVQELHKHPTGLKIGGLVVNVVIVIYLVVRLIRRRRAT